MNLTIVPNEKLNINGIKNINGIDFHENPYKSNNEKNVHLHGRKPLRIRFFANGDKFFPGKKISIHLHRYQNIDELLTELTNKMPPQVYLPNGIRQLFTSSSGRRISEINQLETGRDYVCAGNESYKHISYGKIENDPWFKGRPHNFSRYPQLLPIGFGATNHNPDPNNNYRTDDQSSYAGQNAFPTRFYRPTGQGYINRNGQFASHVFPKLIKFKSKVTNNKNVNYYQDILNQQVKPKVITVVKSGPEIPKSFVRILLNKRSVQSYETLLSDIETSLRDHSHKKMLGIAKIFNLLGKEIKSVGDFFRNDDFFIAISEHESLGINQVKDILNDLYPDHPQTNHILKYWSNKKIEGAEGKDDDRVEDKSKFVSNVNMSVDKRDSGFDEQNFSKESDFNPPNVTGITEKTPLPKPKLSKSKPTIKKKKNVQKKELISNSIQNSVDSDNSIDTENIMDELSSTNYQKQIQERNAIRLQQAYEDREKARIQLQEQVKIERKKFESVKNSSNIYSQYVRKSVADRGSIDVFKKMDEASQEARKQKVREKMERNSYLNDDNNNTISVHVTSSSVDSLEVTETGELPLLETVSTNHKIPNMESNSNYSPKIKALAYNAPSTVGKLNKINEDPAEHNAEINKFDLIIEPPLPVKEKLKKPKIDNEKFNRKKLQRLSQENYIDKQENNNKVFDVSDSTNSVSFTVDSTKLAVDINQEEQITKQEDKDQNNVKEPSNKNIRLSGIVTESSDKTGNQNMPETETHVKRIPSVTPVNEEPLIVNKSDEKNQKSISNSPTSKQTVIAEQKIDSESKEQDDKIISENIPQRRSSLPGSRIMGKLCRQLSSPDIIYQRFEVSKLLGDGNFAVVKLATHKRTKTEYALKVIDKGRMMGKESMIENEIWIMKLCNHENIVKLKEEYETREEVFLVMELVKNGDLFDAITQNVKFSEPVAAKMVTDMANALFYLHSRRIVHRDLKPENLMVLRHKDGSITLKLADFGLAMEIKKLIYTVCGTPTYVAPEILSEKGYSLEVDLWALGVITYILLCGFPPFRSTNRNQEELFQIIQSGNFEFISPYWDKISWEVKDLIRKLLVVDRKLRSSTIDVLSHKWLMSRGRGTQVTGEIQKQKIMELEEIAKENLENFQRQKKELRASINKEIQIAYQSQKK